MLKVAITGGTGFVGRSLLQQLRHLEVVAIGRRKPDGLSCDSFFNLPIDQHADYLSALVGVDVIIHCAARAHVMNDKAVDPLGEYRSVNTAGTLNLAQQAANQGVKRFIFISSVKVNGELTQPGEAFFPEVSKMPEDHYGLSKFEAEEGIKHVSESSGMEFVIIRPPLVYGPGVKANFASLMKLAATGWPMPFGCITQNRRSLVSVDNLVDLILTSIDHRNAANETFLVSDNEDLSTADMLRRLAKACGRTGRLLPVPSKLIECICKLIGKQKAYHRLCGSLQLDISSTTEKLGWYPPYTVDESFAKTAKYYMKHK